MRDSVQFLQCKPALLVQRRLLYYNVEEEEKERAQQRHCRTFSLLTQPTSPWSAAAGLEGSLAQLQWRAS